MSLKQTPVVTCFLESEGKILLLQRSDKVGSYQGKWASVSGYIQSDADRQAYTEIEEETGLTPDDIELVKRGKPLPINDEKLGITWLVHPYLFHVNNSSKISTDWEHRETKWIMPEDLDKYTTVPMLKETLASVWKPLK